MQLETVDLLMMEGMRADESFGPEESSACKSETGVRGEWAVFFKPGADCALWDLAVVSPAHDPLRFGKGVAEIECGDGFENEVKRIRLVLTCGNGEAMQTFGAPKHLQDLQTVAAHTFLNGELASADGAGGILVNLSGCHFVRTEDKGRVWRGGGGELPVFSQQDAGKPVKHGSRILPGWVPGCSSGSRILRCPAGWNWLGLAISVVLVPWARSISGRSWRRTDRPLW